MPNRKVPVQVLAIDDDGVIRSLLTTILAEIGYQVTIAASGTDALRLAATQQYDLLLLDSEVPESNGINLLDEVKSRQFRVSTIVIESDPSHEFSRIMTESEAVRVISTPISDRQFVSAVRDTIKKRTKSKTRSF